MYLTPTTSIAHAQIDALYINSDSSFLNMSVRLMLSLSLPLPPKLKLIKYIWEDFQKYIGVVYYGDIELDIA